VKYTSTVDDGIFLMKSGDYTFLVFYNSMYVS